MSDAPHTSSHLLARVESSLAAGLGCNSTRVLTPSRQKAWDVAAEAAEARGSRTQQTLRHSRCCHTAYSCSKARVRTPWRSREHRISRLRRMRAKQDTTSSGAEAAPRPVAIGADQLRSTASARVPKMKQPSGPTAAVSLGAVVATLAAMTCVGGGPSGTYGLARKHPV